MSQNLRFVIVPKVAHPWFEEVFKGARPEPFTPLGSALLLMNMSQTLSAGTRAVDLSNAHALLDEQVYRLLFPDELPWTDPVIPPNSFNPIHTHCI